jgi:hypothetical protein
MLLLTTASTSSSILKGRKRNFYPPRSS